MSAGPNTKTANPTCRRGRNCSVTWAHSHCTDCEDACAVNRDRCAECEWELRPAELD